DAGTDPATYTVAIAVPFTATAGCTRVRARCNVGGAPVDATSSQTWGETEDYCIQIIPAVPCTGAPAPNSVAGPTYEICPGSGVGLALANSYTLAGITYTWLSSTTSSAGPWSAITGTSTSITVPNNTVSSYFMAVASGSAGGTTSLTPYQSTVQAVITHTPPYPEGFEGIQADNTLPNCSWSASN